MDDDNFFNQVILVDSAISAGLNLLFIIFAVNRFVRNRIGFFNRSKIKWRNSFFIKMLSNIFLSINYFSFALILFDDIALLASIFFFNGATWLISICLLYFEYRRRLDQTWFGLRGFWLINGTIYIIKLICYYLFQQEKRRQIEFVIIVQGIISTILFYYSIFNAKDVETKPMNNRITNNLYEDLLTKETKNNDFFSLGIYDEKKDYLSRIQFSDETKISKSSSLTNRNLFNNYNKRESNYLQIDEATKNNLDNGIIRIEITSLKLRKISKIGNLNTNERDIEKLTNYKFRFMVQILRIFVSKGKSSQKKMQVAAIKDSHQTSSNSNSIGFRNKIDENSNNNDYESDFYTYVFKRNLKEIINFNNLVLEKYEKFIKKKSKLILELKNLNEDFLNKKVFQEISIQHLNIVYIKMCQIYLFFISEFLKFSGVDEETIENVVSNFDLNPKKKKSAFNIIPQNKLFDLNLNTNTNNINDFTNSKRNSILNHNNNFISEFELAANTIKTNNNNNKRLKNFKHESSFFSEIEEKSFLSDNSKIISFINNTLMEKEYVFAQLKEINYSQNKFEISVDLNLTIEKLNFNLNLNNNCNSNNDDDSCSNSLNNSYMLAEKSFYNQKKASVFVTFTFKKLFSYLNNYSASYSKFGIIKSLLSLLNDVNEIVFNSGKKTFEKELTIQLNELLNDLFHIRTEIFYMFNLNKLLSFELNDIDRQIINSIFTAEDENYESNKLFSNHNNYNNNNFYNQNKITYRDKCRSPDYGTNSELNRNQLAIKQRIFQSKDEFNLKSKFNTNKNSDFNFNECINIENYYKNEAIQNDEDHNEKENNLTYKLDFKEIESTKKRFLSPIEKPIITKNILKSISDSYSKTDFLNNNQNVFSYKENVININNFNNSKNLKNNELLSDLDNDSDTKPKYESEKNVNQKSKNNKNNKKSSVLKSKKKEKHNYDRRRSSQSFYRMEKRKSKNDKRRNFDDNTNCEESSNLCHYVKKDLFILNFNLFAELDQMEKIETKSKETFLKFNYPTTNSRNEYDSIITNSNELYNWNITICLEELRTLFRDLQEIAKENFSQLSNHIKSMLLIIEKIVRCYKPITPTGSIISKSNKSTNDNDKSNISERISLTNINTNKKNENILDIVKKDFVSGINKFFLVPNIYVLFSKKFRDLFQIPNVFNLNKEFNNVSQQNEAFNRSDYSNSNKSILENLLN